MPRCHWCTEDPLYQAYHDEEWGVPLRDARRLFELLLLEGFQAGLSWITVLKKRERYRQVLWHFDVQRLAQMSDAEIEERMQDPGIIRNRAKLRAARARIDAYERESGRKIRLEVDGGVKVDNIAEIARAGADAFVAGSAVYGAAKDTDPNRYNSIIAALRAELGTV